MLPAPPVHDLAATPSPELLRALFHEAPTPMWVVDRETLRFLAVNEAAAQRYGWSREEFLGLTLLDIRPPGEEAQLRASVAAPPERGHDAVWQHRTRSGELIDVAVHRAVDLTYAGRPARLVTARDVTSERRAIAALEANERRFRSVLEHAADALVLQDAAGFPFWASASAERVFGRPADQIVGRQGLDFVHPDDRDAIRAARAESLARPFARIRRLARYSVDGEPWRWLETIRENRLGDPAVGAIVLHVRDVTEQKLAEEALRRSEESFRAAIQSSPELVVVLRAGNLVYVNPAVLAALGVEEAEALGRPALAFVAPEDHASTLAALAEVGQRPPRPHQAALVRKDGSHAVIEFIGTAVAFQGASAILVFGRDVTERRRLEARLAMADRLSSLGMLAAGIAHEINNPVSYALANVGFLADAWQDVLPALAGGDRDEVAGALRDTRQGLERVRDIVRDLQTFSRHDEERLGPVDLRGVVDAAAAMTRNEIRHRARLVRRGLDAPRWVRGNAGKLAQVLVNLLVNAAHAIPDGHAGENEVSVEARPLADGRVAVEVRDTGVGIAPEILPRLFEPFFTTKPRALGTGLGLSICHGIVEAHGGAIEVESAPGQGACFRVILPASTPGEDAAAAPAPAGPAARRARVLVVDDEPQVCEAVTRLLGREHEVEAVTESRAALELIRSGARFDAVLCDVMMPDMTGVQLHDAVVALAPAQAARFAFMTGGVFSGETQRLLRQARRPVLEKPFDREALSGCVRRLTAADPTPRR